MSDKPATPPDRLSLDPHSKYFETEHLERGIGIKFNGEERHNVIEYCISEGWIRIAAGKSKDRYGNPMTVKRKGEVEAWYEDTRDQEAEGGDAEETGEEE